MPSHAYGIKLEARHKVKKVTSSPPCNIPRLSIPEFCSRSATSHFTWLFTYLFCCCCLESFVVFERGSHYIVLDGTVLREIPDSAFSVPGAKLSVTMPSSCNFLFHHHQSQPKLSLIFLKFSSFSPGFQWYEIRNDIKCLLSFHMDIENMFKHGQASLHQLSLWKAQLPRNGLFMQTSSLLNCSSESIIFMSWTPKIIIHLPVQHLC